MGKAVFMTPVLVTLTAPTCSGKSYLLNYIRDTANLPCIVSTTTRPARETERHGLDYYFISDQESRDLEKDGQFVELVTFRGFRYGVTKKEFDEKLSQGLSFLILEPNGIEQYVEPVKEHGALWFKYYIDVFLNVQIDRFKKRFDIDLMKLLKEKNDEKTLQLVRTYTDRLIHMLTVERTWRDGNKWNLILNGAKEPEANLKIILRDINNDVSFCRASDHNELLLDCIVWSYGQQKLSGEQ